MIAWAGRDDGNIHVSVGHTPLGKPFQSTTPFVANEPLEPPMSSNRRPALTAIPVPAALKGYRAPGEFIFLVAWESHFRLPLEGESTSRRVCSTTPAPHCQTSSPSMP